MQTDQIKDLLKRYAAGTCTEQEKALVESAYLKYNHQAKPLTEEEIAEDLELIKSRLPKMGVSRRFSFFPKAVAAAAVLLLAASVTFYLARPVSKERNVKTKQEKQMILPGKDQAILTLADGRKVVLDKNASTLVSDASTGIRIKKTAAGELVYETLKIQGPTSATVAYNTIQTPRGSQFKVILPDGTGVWLNAASSLHYPVVFKGAKRAVELSGEAYFEVAKNPDMPFIVHTGNQEVQVLGTHFNISAYNEPGGIKTTLLEGKVMVSQAGQKKLMKPGQQVVNRGQSLVLEDLPDAQESIAWKNGLFLFNHEDLHSIMNKISRWYDIDVEYKNDFKAQYYSGTISKFGSVTEVLKIMELTKSVKFKIEGRRIIVMK